MIPHQDGGYDYIIEFIKRRNDMAKWKRCGLPYGPSYNTDGSRKKTFSSEGLAKPGTIIEVDLPIGRRKTEVKEFLIGDINPLRGVCDDCVGFDKETVVLRYRRIEK